jgi:hypothetical protein
MASRTPDDFTLSTRQALAHRASHKCSFRDCQNSTSGPSDESPTSYFNIGVAAHIHGARPTSARHLPEMTSRERRDIKNGIWMCQTHAKLIDDDACTYSADELRSRCAHQSGFPAMRARLCAGCTDRLSLQKASSGSTCTDGEGTPHPADASLSAVCFAGDLEPVSSPPG